MCISFFRFACMQWHCFYNLHKQTPCIIHARLMAWVVLCNAELVSYGRNHVPDAGVAHDFALFARRVSRMGKTS